jgi:phosphoglycerol transferase
LGPDASVFELPYVTFPEAGATFAAGPYDHVRGFLHAPQLDWSWGEIRGRRPNWQARAAGLPPKRQLDAIAAAGFDGILIDRDAYQDHAQLIEFALAKELGEQPEVSSDTTLSFFDIRDYAAELEAELGPEAFAELRVHTLAAQD